MRIDLSDPVNTPSTPTGWSRGPTGRQRDRHRPSRGSRSPSGATARPGRSPLGAVATVGATTGTTSFTPGSPTPSAIRTSARTRVQIDNTAPVDDTDPPDGWQHQVTDVSIEGTDVDSGVGHVEWELDGIRGTGDTGDTVSIGHGIHELKTRIIDAVGNADRVGDARSDPGRHRRPGRHDHGPVRLGDRRQRGRGERHRDRLDRRRRRPDRVEAHQHADGHGPERQRRRPRSPSPSRSAATACTSSRPGSPTASATIPAGARSTCASTPSFRSIRPTPVAGGCRRPGRQRHGRRHGRALRRRARRVEPQRRRRAASSATRASCPSPPTA